jgi:hypothetical protein
MLRFLQGRGGEELSAELTKALERSFAGGANGAGEENSEPQRQCMGGELGSHSTIEKTLEGSVRHPLRERHVDQYTARIGRELSLI